MTASIDDYDDNQSATEICENCGGSGYCVACKGEGDPVNYLCGQCSSSGYCDYCNGQGWREV